MRRDRLLNRQVASTPSRPLSQRKKHGWVYWDARLQIGSDEQPGGYVADHRKTHPDAPDTEVQGDQELSRDDEPTGQINAAIAR